MFDVFWGQASGMKPNSCSEGKEREKRSPRLTKTRRNERLQPHSQQRAVSYHLFMSASRPQKWIPNCSTAPPWTEHPSLGNPWGFWFW